MSKNIFALIVVVLLVPILYFVTSGTKKEGLKIGALYTLTGPASSFGELSANGVRDAVKYFEEKNNTKVELFMEDTANDPKQGVSAITKLINLNKVKFVVVGPSGIASAVSPISEKNKIITITDGAAYGITKDKEYLFQNILTSLNNIPEQINKNNEWKRIAIVNINDEFGNIWKEEWKKGISNTKTIETFSFEKTTTDFKTEALKIKAFNPDVVAFVGYGPSLNQVFADLSVQKINAPYITYLSCTLPGVLSDKRFDLNGNYSYEYPEYQNNEIKEWIEKNGGKNSAFYALTFENTLLALNAQKESNGDTGKALLLLKNKAIQGIYGDLIFDKGQSIKRDLTLTKIQNNTCVR